MDQQEDEATLGGAEMSRGTQESQKVLVLLGLPGSGKSTLANALVEASESPTWSQHAVTGEADERSSEAGPSKTRRRWVRASQDDAPSRRRQECEGVVRQALSEGHNVIVDRVNFDPAQRAHFVHIADQHTPRPQVISLLLSTSQETLAKRLSVRESHPTIPNYETAQKVLRQMESAWSPPNPSRGEGFDRIFVLPEADQPSDGLWSEEKLVEVLDRAVRDGQREVGPRTVFPAPALRGRGRGGFGVGRDGRDGGRGGWNGPPRDGYARGGHSRGGYGGYGGHSGHAQASAGYRPYDGDRPGQSNGYSRPNPYPQNPYAVNHSQQGYQASQYGSGSGYTPPSPYAPANRQYSPYRPPAYQPREPSHSQQHRQ